MSDWRPTASLATLEARAALLRSVREYFTATRALEVETPTLSHAAVSDVHLASIKAVANGAPCFLHTSPEYAMKRLLAAGAGDIWQLCRVYRDHERGRHHNPEFTMLEWYRLGVDHHGLMNDVERLLSAVLPASRQFDRAERITYREALHVHAGVDAFEDPTALLIARLRSAEVDVPAALERERDACLDLIMAVLVGPHLGRERPCFVYDYPASQAALARIHGQAAARFELYLDGIELANGFHELADAHEQRRRFDQDLEERARRGLDRPPLDERFLAALAHGLPDCAGVALGFDRLVMCAVGAQHIEEVLAFPFERA